MRYHLRKGCVRAQTHEGLLVPRTGALVAMSWCGDVLPTGRFRKQGKLCEKCRRIRVAYAQLRAARPA